MNKTSKIPLAKHRSHGGKHGRLLDMRERLEKWRHLIEPTIAQSATPMPWAKVLEKEVQVFEAQRSVVVTVDGSILGKPACMIWVAAGELNEVSSLIEQAKELARTAGIDQLVYLGRRGWVRALGFREIAVLAVQEL